MMMENRGPQANGVGVAGVVDPTLYAGGELVEGDVAVLIGLYFLAKTTLKGDPFAPFEAAAVGIGDKAEKGDALGDRLGVGMGMEGEAQFGRLLLNGMKGVPERLFAVGEEEHVIDVAQVAGDAQATLDEMVERAEIAVGPKLGGEVADREAARPGRGEQVVAGEVNNVVLLGQHIFAPFQNEIDEVTEAWLFDFAPEGVAQDGVVDAGEKLAQVELKKVGIAAGVLLGTRQGPMGPFADPVGVGVGDKATVKDRFDQVAEGVMHNAISEGCG